MRHFALILLFSIIIFTSYSQDRNLLIKDKSATKDCIITLIQYYKQNPDEIDPRNFFEPYSKRKIKITIDSIFYRKDCLVSLIFIVFEVQNDEDVHYDSRAIMGLRDDINQTFKLYPLTQYNIIDYPTYQKSIFSIMDCYANKIKNDKDRFGNKFECGFKNKDFWQKSLYFKRIKNRYYFQTYLGKPDDYIDLIYPSCQ
jgi:hypothetical protein